MRLLNTHTLKLESFVDDRNRPEYAILSHVWEDEEVVFADLEKDDPDQVQSKKGYGKLVGTCRQARKHGYDWAWIDSCCIDKSSSAELSEAINAMYAWYGEAAICYVYLADVEGQYGFGVEQRCHPFEDEVRSVSSGCVETPSIQNFVEGQHGSGVKQRCHSFEDEVRSLPSDYVETPSIQNIEDGTLVHLDREIVARPEWHDRFVASKWFTRGWTLQELIAPRHIVFYSAHWNELGLLKEVERLVAKASRLPLLLLRHNTRPEDYSIAQRMSWASRRTTTRIEDQAYCLLGLFGINMPLIYGERSKAFVRLQEAILNSSTDLSVLAWHHSDDWDGYRGQLQILAPSAKCFLRSTHVRVADSGPATLTNQGLSTRLRLGRASRSNRQSRSGTHILDLQCSDSRDSGKNADNKRVMLCVKIQRRTPNEIVLEVNHWIGDDRLCLVPASSLSRLKAKDIVLAGESSGLRLAPSINYTREYNLLLRIGQSLPPTPSFDNLVLRPSGDWDPEVLRYTASDIYPAEGGTYGKSGFTFTLTSDTHLGQDRKPDWEGSVTFGSYIPQHARTSYRSYFWRMSRSDLAKGTHQIRTWTPIGYGNGMSGPEPFTCIRCEGHTAGSTGANNEQPHREREQQIQLLFDVLYLGRSMQSKKAETSLHEKALELYKHLDIDQSARERLTKNANDYWKRTYLLFGLLVYSDNNS